MAGCSNAAAHENSLSSGNATPGHVGSVDSAGSVCPDQGGLRETQRREKRQNLGQTATGRRFPVRTVSIVHDHIMFPYRPNNAHLPILMRLPALRHTG